MSLPYDRYDHGSSRRRVWTHWVPLAVTLTVATAGLAVWAWKQSRDDDSDHIEPGLDYGNAEYGEDAPYGSANRSNVSRKPPSPDDGQSRGEAPAPSDASASSWGARMSGALRRTPSPQQLLDSTGKTVAAGVAAAGAVVGKALASIREEDRAYSENPWSEEADAKQGREQGHEQSREQGVEQIRERGPQQSRAHPASGKKQKIVAVVISADTHVPQQDEDGSHAMASILSHIPRHIDHAAIKLYILIYAPDLKDSSPDNIASNLPPASLSSSFSNIGHDQAQSPSTGTKTPQETAPTGSNAAFNAMYTQAVGLVDRETMILPFTTPTGHVHILRQIQPEVVYLQESLSGENGTVVASLQTWLRHDVVLVVGAEHGSGGLADSEPEGEASSEAALWWQKPEKVGRGRGVVVVDGMRVHDDWVRRVQGKE